MIRKIIVAGALVLLVSAGSSSAQDSSIQDTKPIQDTEAIEELDGFYKQINELDFDRIVDLYKQNPKLFFNKYKNYGDPKETFNKSLDAKVFDGLSDIFTTHRILNLEEKLYVFNSKEDLEDLEPFLLVDRNTIDKNHAYSLVLHHYIFNNILTKEPEEILKETYSNLKKTIKFKKTNDVLLNMSLDKGRLDSFQLSLFYYDLGKQLDLPFSVIRVKDHFFIQYNQDSFFNSLDGHTYTKAEMEDNYNISPKSVNNGIYLKPLTEDQMIAIEYAKIGWYCRIQAEEYIYSDLIEGAFQAFDNSFVLDHNNTDSLEYRGQLFHFMDFIDHALEDYKRIIELDPTNWLGYALQGTAFYDKGDIDGAISAFRKAYKFNKNMEKDVPQEIRSQVVPIHT